MDKYAEITEDSIRVLVDRFYGAVRTDDLIGPIFQEKVKDWDQHLPKMVDFWSGVMLQTDRYTGRPMPAHAQISNISRAHFERWLGLFQDAAHEVFEQDAAASFIERSHMIADNFQHLLFHVMGRDPNGATP